MARRLALRASSTRLILPVPTNPTGFFKSHNMDQREHNQTCVMLADLLVSERIHFISALSGVIDSYENRIAF